jgi:FHS family glucose/mannose:H+ symporter-like MFS transporter
MTAGRFIAVPLSLRWPASSLLTVCCAGMAGFLLLATVPAVAPYAYFGVGLMMAPIFPTCLPWLKRAVPGVGAAGAYVIAASMIGGVAFPPLLGAAIEQLGVRAVPLLLFGLAAVCVALSVWLRGHATGHRPDGAPKADPTPVAKGTV